MIFKFATRGFRIFMFKNMDYLYDGTPTANSQYRLAH
jgi:hypothetical protein